MYLFFLILFSYLLGSIPVGLVLSKAFSKQDPRQVGSGNIGATNVLRTAGRVLALLTLTGDALKGFIPVSLGMAWHLSEVWISLAALAAFLGHLFPVFLRFKGGKGVATALGVFLAICPLAVAIDFFLFAGVLVTGRIVSVGSMSAASLMPVLLWIFTGSQPYVVMSTSVAILIVYRHRANIERLLKGRENRIDLRLGKKS
ncbi:MAG: glycerol-3-phosphate 1-O-acyltransferase PlsY [Deltaproteobacteria bacterium]|nr:glycerol-3-phosphate 1-O-acyltransferase PlsY [Deltaproteobacteria bacterium]